MTPSAIRNASGVAPGEEPPFPRGETPLVFPRPGKEAMAKGGRGFAFPGFGYIIGAVFAYGKA